MAFAMTLNGQDLRCLSADDVKTVRQIIADREFYKQRAENAEAMTAAVAASRDGWKALAEAEKKRADEVQGGRITELTAANTQLHIQAAADKQKIGELNADIIRLKSGRKWYFGAGAALGVVGGYFIGKKIGTIRTIFQPAPAQFGASFRF